MDELNQLLKPSWGAEQWIFEGWKLISAEEKKLITARVDELFKDGLPIELKHDKLFYIYTFSLLAQLEVLAIQVPLKFEEKMISPLHKERMHTQLLDEIFHGIVFTKIVYLLCAPHAVPPLYNDNIEALCNFIRNEEDPKVGVVLLNLIGEGWIEEFFYSLQACNIAPKVFATILEDEHRHVCEADLYRDIGLPDKKIMRVKLDYLEKQLLAHVFFQYKYVSSLSSLIGMQGVKDFLQSLNTKYTGQLKKINLHPGEKWTYFFQMTHEVLPRIHGYAQDSHAVEMSPMRQVLMTQWDNPSDPTMAGQFNINISCLHFFDKKYPAETLTSLMLQAISHTLLKEVSFRSFLNHKKLYHCEKAYTALVVQLPECGDHMGAIVFQDCHNLPIQVLSARIRQVMQMMVYCYKKREQLEQKHPHLKQEMNASLDDFSYGLYPYPMPGTPIVSLSNIGQFGYTQAKSPLRSTEAMKFTLFQVDKRLVWDKETNAFEPQDLLPVSVSADHRLMDGNIPLPKLLAQSFKEMFENMQQKKEKPAFKVQESQMIKGIDHILNFSPEAGYKTLLLLQTMWFDFMSIEELLQPEIAPGDKRIDN